MAVTNFPVPFSDMKVISSLPCSALLSIFGLFFAFFVMIFELECKVEFADFFPLCHASLLANI